jgi:hypothetical protein
MSCEARMSVERRPTKQLKASLVGTGLQSSYRPAILLCRFETDDPAEQIQTTRGFRKWSAPQDMRRFPKDYEPCMGPSSSREESSQICTSSYAGRFDGHPSLPLERLPVGAPKFTRRQAKGIHQFFGYAADFYNVVRELSNSTPYNFNRSVCVLFGHYIGDRYTLPARRRCPYANKATKTHSLCPLNGPRYPKLLY